MPTSAVVVVFVGLVLTACGRLGFEEQRAAPDSDAAAAQPDGIAPRPDDAASSDAAQLVPPTSDVIASTFDLKLDAALNVPDAAPPDANSRITELDAAAMDATTVLEDANAADDASRLDSAAMQDAVTPDASAADAAEPDAGVQDATVSDAGEADAAPQTCPAVAPKAGFNKLIDDLEDGDGVIIAADGRSGFWYTANDGTAGTQTPVPGTNFVPASGGAHGSAYYARTTGRAFADWGAALCIMLHQVGDNACRYNAASTSGLRFAARGTGTITVSFATAATVPIENGGSCFSGCFDYHSTTFTLSSTWLTRQIAYTSLAQGGWGTPAYFQASALMYIEFAAGPATAFDIGLDDVSFY